MYSSLEKSLNPNIVSNVPLCSADSTVPGIHSENDSSQAETTASLNRRTSTEQEESTGDDSSKTSIPRDDSMSPSVRSCDQGYAASGTSDDDASFNTPLGEVKSAGSLRKRSLRDTISTPLMKKLLENSQKERSTENGNDTWETEGENVFSKILDDLMESCVMPPGLSHTGKIASRRKYTPAGVRRSKSNVDSCCRSLKGINTHAAILNDRTSSSKRIVSRSAENVHTSPYLHGARMSQVEDTAASSRAILTKQDETSSIDMHQVSTVQSHDPILLPAVGTKPRESYRRTHATPREESHGTDISDDFTVPSRAIPQATSSSIITLSSATEYPTLQNTQGNTSPDSTAMTESSSSMPANFDAAFPACHQRPLVERTPIDCSFHDNAHSNFSACTKTDKNGNMPQPLCPASGESAEEVKMLLENNGIMEDKSKQERTERLDGMMTSPGATDHVTSRSDDGKLRVTADKECQTSAWLINSLHCQKTLKQKPIINSCPPTRTQQQQDQHRRESSASYKFALRDHEKIMEAFQTSSLRDIPKTCSHEADIALKTDTHILLSPLSELQTGTRISGSGSCMVDGQSSDFVTTENELNIRTLAVSQETDIIEDDLLEPGLSLDNMVKQQRFDHLPLVITLEGDEPMTSTSRRHHRQRGEKSFRDKKRKCAHCCKKCVAFIFSHVGLCSLVVAYTIIGGFLFEALENNAENTVRRTVRDQRQKVVGQLISLAVQLDKTEQGIDNLTTEVNSTVLEYQSFIYEITKDKGWDGMEEEDVEGLWTFATSLLYAITVTTTIGYGHVSPKTPEGRLATIGYAVLGIPLTLLCLTNIGDVMATGFRLLYGNICCGICCKPFMPRRRSIQPDLEKGQGDYLVAKMEQEANQAKEPIKVPTSLCLLLIAGYILAGAMLFSLWESWDMLTGSYFCFITLSTIGFGDIVPGMDTHAWAAEEKLVLCALYLVLGLSLIAMCFNLVQEDVKAKCRWLGMKLGIVEKHVIQM